MDLRSIFIAFKPLWIKAPEGLTRLWVSAQIGNAGFIQAQAPCWIPTVLIATGTAPVLVACAGFLYLLLKQPDKLQSEDYQLRKEILMLIQQGSPPQVIDAVLAPELPNSSVNRQLEEEAK